MGAGGGTTGWAAGAGGVPSIARGAPRVGGDTHGRGVGRSTGASIAGGAGAYGGDSVRALAATALAASNQPFPS